MNACRATEIFNDTDLKLIVVEAVDFSYGQTGPGCSVYGTLAPVAVVICHRQRVYALGMDAEPVVLERLRSTVPELDALIDSPDPAIHD